MEGCGFGIMDAGFPSASLGAVTNQDHRALPKSSSRADVTDPAPASQASRSLRWLPAVLQLLLSE